ncbi:MAG: ABC transporter substrate-binding protein [Betaproteobacteria bacterium]|nr:ABC transporter substrate-binding protein [Betaproteobacteria bacterium]
MKTAVGKLFSVLGLAAALIGLPLSTSAQDRYPIATFTFPSVTNIYADIIFAKGFDKANGLRAEPVTYGTGAALWAGLASGEIVVHNMSPFLLQKMRSDGIDIEMFATFLGMGWTIVTTNPAIKNFADLKGKSIAATVAFSAFDYLQIYSKKVGINLRKDISIVDATNVLMLAQLEAGRVDAILAYEPNTTMLLAKNPKAKVVLFGVDAWQAVAGDSGWDLGLVVRTDFLKKNPGILPRIFKMYRDAATFATSNPEEADKIVTSGKHFTKGIPPGTIASGLKAKRLILEVNPTWQPATNAQIWKMLQAGLDGGYIPALPAKQAVVSVAPK